MKKIAIIGYGASAIGFLYGILYKSDIKDIIIDVFDQNNRQAAGGLGGLKYDGKLVVGQFSGTDELIDINIQLELLQFIAKDYIVVAMDVKQTAKNQIKKIGHDFHTFYDKSMELFRQYTFHLGTDQLVKVNQRILNDFNIQAKKKQISLNFIFNTKIHSVADIEHKYDKTILAVGRYGTNLVKQTRSFLLKNHIDDPVISDSKVDLGVRLEVPSRLPDIQLLDNSLYEWKTRYKTSNNLICRTFCHNPHGYIVVQDMNVMGDNITIINGHSKKNSQSDNTNLAILVSHTFTEPFNNSVLFGKNIAQQANSLAGGNRVILQTVGDFMKMKRTKKLFRVHPTLNGDKYILGDLSYVLPAKTYGAIVQFMKTLSNVVPSIMFDDNLLYGVEVKFYGTKIRNTQKIKFIGDCSGFTRSIISASVSGYLLSKEIL